MCCKNTVISLLFVKRCVNFLVELNSNFGISLQENYHGPNHERYFSEESLHQEDFTRPSGYSAGKI